MERQHGVVARRQLIVLGLGRGAIDARVRIGHFGYSTAAFTHRAAFENDRARDAAMQAAAYRVIRLTHRQLETEAPRIAAQLRKMLGTDPPASKR